MSIYNEQYRRYYEGLKGKEMRTGMKTDRPQEYPYIYSGYSRNNSKKNKRNNLSGWVNVYIYQLIITVVLALTILYMKYSSNLQVVDAFKTFKTSVNETVSYSEFYKEIKSQDVNVIINKAKNSFQWIKEKIDENPLNY